MSNIGGGECYFFSLQKCPNSNFNILKTQRGDLNFSKMSEIKLSLILLLKQIEQAEAEVVPSSSLVKLS